MRRFLISLLLCLAPFSAKADDFLSSLTEFAANQISSTLPRIFDSVDSSLRSYVDKDDYQTIADNDAAFYYSSPLAITNLLGYEAAYNPKSNDIFINAYYNKSKTLLQGLIHHEVQHLKDYAILKERGYDSKTFTTDLDKTSQMLFGGIMEARAYIEQAAFIYTKTEDLLNNKKNLSELIKKIDQKGMPLPPSMEYQYLKSVVDESFYLLNEDSKSVTAESIKDLYERISNEYSGFKEAKRNQGNPAASTFNAIMERDGNIEEAKHTAMLSLIDGIFFKEMYLRVYSVWSSGDLHISPEEFFEIFGDDYFTLEDFYAAEGFWRNVCNNKKTTQSDDCRSFWGRYETKHCPNLREKWLSCGRLELFVNADKNCKKCKSEPCSEKSKRILTDEKDDKALSDCCRFKYFPFFH